MEPYFRSTPGILTSYYRDQFGNESSRSTATDSGYEYLYDVQSYKGNFKTPLPQRYTHMKQTGRKTYVRVSKLFPDGSIDLSIKSGMDYPNGSMANHSDEGAFNQCLSRLGESIRGSTDISIDAFQFGQTVRLAKSLLSVRHAVTRLAELTWRDTSVSQRRRSAVTRYWSKQRADSRHRVYQRRVFEQPMKEVGSVWLGFQYGVKPTLQTLHDLVTREADRAGNAMIIRSKTGREGVTGKSIVESVSKLDAPWFKTRDVFKTTFRYKIGGYYLPSSSHLEAASRLTSLNPVSIAWELLPFSFVVDWVVDIGGYLRSIETAMISNLGQFRGYQTFTKREEAAFSTMYNGTDAQGYEYLGSITSANVRTSKNRSLLVAIPFPERPRFKADLGSGRLLNAAALLSQALGRHK